MQCVSLPDAGSPPEAQATVLASYQCLPKNYGETS